MNMNDIIDNNTITNKVRSAYKCINKNKELTDKVVENIFHDIKNQFSDITEEDKNILIINIKDETTIDSCKEMVNDCISSHFNNMEESDIHEAINLLFKINTYKNKIKITRKK